NHVTPSTITALRKDLGITQDDVDAKKVELGIPSTEKLFKKKAEPASNEPEQTLTLFTEPTTNDMEKFWQDNMPEPEIQQKTAGQKEPEENTEEWYCLVEDNAIIADDLTLTDALEQIKCQHTLYTVGKVRLLKEIPFVMNVTITV
ncbi:MAG: hypothetical protein ACYC4E_00135, partial [Carboxydocellales bacterium]